MTRRGWVLFCSLGLIWGLPYLLIRVAVREVDPAFLVLVRTAGGALLLLPFTARRGALLPLLRCWKALVAYTFIEIAIPWYLLFNAERRLTSSLTGLLVATVPIAGAALAMITGTDHLDRRRILGLCLGIVGVATLVGFDVHGSSLLAALSLSGVAMGYALGPWILGRHLSQLPAMSVVTTSLVLCAFVYAPAAAFQLPTTTLSGSVIASIVTLTVLCTALGFVVLFSLVGEVGAMRSTVVTYVNPAVAVLLGTTILGEPFGVGTGIGFVLILGGSFLATRPARVREEARVTTQEPTRPRPTPTRSPTIAEP
jgi:drug/metabolite transporter (DMT)-like permease